MDFSLSDELVELKERTERFVREQILPYENDPRQTAHGPAEELRRELVGLGRRAGLLSPHVGPEWGGLGLDHRATAVVFFDRWRIFPATVFCVDLTSLVAGCSKAPEK